MIQSSSAVLDHAWAVFRGRCELTEAVCDSERSGGKASPDPECEWSFVGQTPAELCLLLLKWLTCTSNLSGLPTPESLGHPSWRCSVVLAPVLHRPSCKGYNSCLCLGRANTTWLQNCIDCLCQGVKFRDFVKGRQCGFVLAGEFEVMCAKYVQLFMSVSKSICFFSFSASGKTEGSQGTSSIHFSATKLLVFIKQGHSS